MIKLRAYCKICGYFGNHKRTEKDWIYYCNSCRSKGPPVGLDCNGVNAKGKACRHWKVFKSDYCAHHKNQGESK